VIGIEIARRNYLLYLPLPHRIKSRLLTPVSRAKPDRIDRALNEAIYSHQRFRVERRLGGWPFTRHWAAVLALEARRLPESR
jgi:hypothetical protein